MYNKIYNLDCLTSLKSLKDCTINLVITSPPFNKLNKTKRKGKIENAGGDYILENYENYDDNMPEKDYQVWQMQIINELNRILKDDGSIFYHHKPRRYKGEELHPFEWLYYAEINLYQTIIINYNSHVDSNKHYFRPTWEYLFWLTKTNKSPKFYKEKAIFEKAVWDIKRNRDKMHPCPFPINLVKNCILTTTDENDIILDPFAGIGTVCYEAYLLDRQYLGFEISKKYINHFNNKIDKINKIEI